MKLSKVAVKKQPLVIIEIVLPLYLLTHFKKTNNKKEDTSLFFTTIRFGLYHSTVLLLRHVKHNYSYLNLNDFVSA